MRKHSIRSEGCLELDEMQKLRRVAMGEEYVEEGEVSVAKERLRQITTSS